MREMTDLHIAIFGTEMYIDKDARDKISDIFEEYFGSRANKVSDVSEADSVEIIYSVATPVFETTGSSEDFFDNLLSVIEELDDFSPFFTTFESEVI